MRRFLTTAIAVTLLGGCGSTPDPDPLPPPIAAPSSPAAPATTGTGPAAKPAAKPKTAAPRPKKTEKAAVLPENLVGAWNSITERGNAFSYEFTADGKYLYNGIMQDGDLRYTLQEGGRASISGTRITLRPQQTVVTRTENGASTTTRPDRGARQMRFQVSGNRLTFTESDGAGSVYQRG
jgi:hypothetical protein